jgi:hypothetical protein
MTVRRVERDTCSVRLGNAAIGAAVKEELGDLEHG